MKITSSFKNPSLDIIERHPQQTTRPPILFVHGANMSAWCWDENLMSFFAEHGHPTYALSLRGHGKSGGHQHLSSHSIADYVTDVELAISAIGEPPILIGHSMGGLIIQNYIEKNPVPACVLMAPVPAQGLLPSLFDLAFYNPSFYTQLGLVQFFGTWSSAVDITRESIFSGHVSDDVVIRYCAQMQPESPRALLDTLWLGLPVKKNPLNIPMLALGADDDIFFRPHHIKKTAEAHNADYINIENISHAMMLDAHWQKGANAIKGWLNKL